MLVELGGVAGFVFALRVPTLLGATSSFASTVSSPVGVRFGAPFVRFGGVFVRSGESSSTSRFGGDVSVSSGTAFEIGFSPDERGSAFSVLSTFFEPDFFGIDLPWFECECGGAEPDE